MGQRKDGQSIHCTQKKQCKKVRHNKVHWLVPNWSHVWRESIFYLVDFAASQEHPAGTSCTPTWWTTVNKKWDDVCRDLGLSHFLIFLGNVWCSTMLFFEVPIARQPHAVSEYWYSNMATEYTCAKIIVDFLWAATYSYGGCLPDWLLELKGHHVCFCFHVQIYVLCWIPTGPNGTHPEVRVYTVCIYNIYIYIQSMIHIYIYICTGLIKAYQPGYLGVNV